MQITGAPINILTMPAREKERERERKEIYEDLAASPSVWRFTHHNSHLKLLSICLAACLALGLSIFCASRLRISIYIVCMLLYWNEILPRFELEKIYFIFNSSSRRSERERKWQLSSDVRAQPALLQFKEICEFYVVQKRRATDSDAPKL